MKSDKVEAMKNLLKLYGQGWDAHRHPEKHGTLEERLLELNNDLAEDIFVKERCTQANLVRLVGYMAARADFLNNRVHEERWEIFNLWATLSKKPPGRRSK